MFSLPTKMYVLGVSPESCISTLSCVRLLFLLAQVGKASAAKFWSQGSSLQANAQPSARGAWPQKAPLASGPWESAPAACGSADATHPAKAARQYVNGIAASQTSGDEQCGLQGGSLSQPQSPSQLTHEPQDAGMLPTAAAPRPDSDAALAAHAPPHAMGDADSKQPASELVSTTTTSQRDSSGPCSAQRKAPCTSAPGLETGSGRLTNSGASRTATSLVHHSAVISSFSSISTAWPGKRGQRLITFAASSGQGPTEHDLCDRPMHSSPASRSDQSHVSATGAVTTTATSSPPPKMSIRPSWVTKGITAALYTNPSSIASPAASASPTAYGSSMGSSRSSSSSSSSTGFGSSTSASVSTGSCIPPGTPVRVPSLPYSAGDDASMLHSLPGMDGFRGATTWRTLDGSVPASVILEASSKFSWTQAKKAVRELQPLLLSATARGPFRPFFLDVETTAQSWTYADIIDIAVCDQVSGESRFSSYTAHMVA